MEFVQESITTLHDYEAGSRSAVDLDDVAVVVPMAARDRGAAIDDVLEPLAARNCHRIVVPYRATAETARRIADQLGALGDEVVPLWCDAPALADRLHDGGLGDATGKGRDVWIGMGVATAGADRVVLRDADATVDASVVDRLVAGLEVDHDFAKGYYARVEDRFYGRLCRLCYEPLVRAFPDGEPLVRYLRGFRYALAGEMAMTASLARRVRFEPGFGLEVGLLGEAYRVVGADRTVQVDLGRHRHAHRPVRGEDGLASIATTVVAALLRVLDDAGVGYVIPELRERYRRIAADLVDAYAADAAFNGLPYDADDEREQVRLYGEAIQEPETDDRLPAWTDVDLDAADIREAATPPE